MGWSPATVVFFIQIHTILQKLSAAFHITGQTAHMQRSAPFIPIEAQNTDILSVRKIICIILTLF